MEDILASIKKVIAEEKEMRTVAPRIAQPGPAAANADDSDDVLELDQPLGPPADLGPPLLDPTIADSSRQSLENLSSIAASAPPAPVGNPLEEMVRDMLRPVLKQWLDEYLPGIVDEHVKREISRITGRTL